MRGGDVWPKLMVDETETVRRRVLAIESARIALPAAGRLAHAKKPIHQQKSETVIPVPIENKQLFVRCPCDERR